MTAQRRAVTSRPNRGWASLRPPRRAHLASRRYGLRSSVLSPRIDALFAKLDRPGQPGGMVAVLRGGEVVHLAAYGVAAVESDLPFDAGTVLRLGSTTKHLAASAILLLEDRGLLALDDDVRRFLPELPDLGSTITLRHLLTMTSGIPDGLTRLLFAGHSARHPVAQSSLVELFRRGRGLLFQPGEQCSYSNTNYSLLAMVLERLTGASLRDFLRREFFAPFGMTRTDLVPDAREVVPGLALGYEPADESTPIGATAGGLSHPVVLPGRALGRRRRQHDARRSGALAPAPAPERRAGAPLAPAARAGGRARERASAPATASASRSTRIAVCARWDTAVACRAISATSRCSRIRAAGSSATSASSRCGTGWIRRCSSRRRASSIWCSRRKDGRQSSRATPRRSRSRPRPLGLRVLYACFETGELLAVVEKDGQTIGFYLGEPTPLVVDRDGSLHGAKRGLGFSLRPAPSGEVAGALEARFGASPPRIFQPVAVPTAVTGDAESDRGGFDDYAGRYRSDELGEEMIVAVAEGGHGLAVRLGSPLRPLLWQELRRLAGDLFYAVIAGCPTVTNVSALFRRDAAGRVTALVHQTSRAGAIAFERSGG